VRCVNTRVLTNANILNVRSPAAIVVAGWSGCQADTVSSSITATGTVESLALNFPLDINNAQVIKNNGDMCTARLAAGANISAGSPVIYDSVNAHWYKLAGQGIF
jgi:hypothetical protein